MSLSKLTPDWVSDEEGGEEGHGSEVEEEGEEEAANNDVRRRSRGRPLVAPVNFPRRSNRSTTLNHYTPVKFSFRPDSGNMHRIRQGYSQR